MARKKSKADGAETKNGAPKAEAKQAKAKGGGEGLGSKAAELKEFFDQSKVEMKKVTWPSRKETITTSVAVLVLAVVMAVFLGLVDLGLSKAIQAILS
jgi:preprotein translocase subunit SecE